MRKGRGLRRRGETFTAMWEELSGLAEVEQNQGVTNLLSTLSKIFAFLSASIAAVP